MKKGWQTKTIGDVCDVMNGGTPKTGVPEYWDGNHRWITPAEMGKRVSPYVSDTERKITDLGLRDSSARMLPPNSVILSSRAPIGHLVINTEPMGTNQGCKGLIPRSQIETKFLYYYLSSIVDLLNSLGTGATFKELSGGKLKEVTVPVPPLAEQQRIVGLLDEAFECLATAKANAEKNLQNARALFESHLQSVFTQRGPGWVEKSLGETCEMYQPKTIGTKDLVPDGPYPVFGANGVIGRYDKFNHEEPQLLVTCRGATCGSVNISEPNSWITGNAMVVRPKDHALDLHFLEFVFRGGIDISAAITGAAQPQITRTNLSPLLIRFPKSVTEQTRLAEKFEALTDETQRLAAIYSRKHAALEALQKSLLHQAFSGEL
jgi:type I restriction enzyme, S subunit